MSQMRAPQPKARKRFTARLRKERKRHEDAEKDLRKRAALKVQRMARLAGQAQHNSELALAVAQAQAEILDDIEDTLSAVIGSVQAGRDVEALEIVDDIDEILQRRPDVGEES